MTQPSEPALGTAPHSPAYIDHAFDAFVQSSMTPGVRYADLHTGSRKDGELIACEIAFQVHETWEQTLAHGNPHQHAMKLLRGEIVRYCAEHGISDAMATHAAILRAMRARQEQFAVLEETFGVEQTATNGPAPSLHPRYRGFTTATGRSAGAPRDGTQPLDGFPAQNAPSHHPEGQAVSGHAFSCSTRTPQTGLASSPRRTPPGQSADTRRGDPGVS